MKKVLLLVLLLSACTTFNGNYAAISTQPVSLYDLSSQNRVVARNADTVVSRHVAVIIPFAKAPTLASAIDKLLKEYDGDYIKNAKIERKSFQLMWAYHYTAWKISGDVVSIR